MTTNPTSTPKKQPPAWTPTLRFCKHVPCGDAFMPTAPNHRFCSSKCRAEHNGSGEGRPRQTQIEKRRAEAKRDCPVKAGRSIVIVSKLVEPRPASNSRPHGWHLVRWPWEERRVSITSK